MKTKQLATCAVMTALLIAMQYAFSFVSGVELVTAFFLAFCYVFGVRCGILTGIAFSLLRCVLFGFMPNVILLYLLYYTLFALLFGVIGGHNMPAWVCPTLLFGICLLCAFFAIRGLPISALYKTRVTVMLWVLFAILAALLVFYCILLRKDRSEGGRELAQVTALAAFCTVLFTLLDDVITPLTLGYSREAASAYFYTGFLAMLPQTICAAVSVFVLFLPLKRVFEAAKRSAL